MNASQIMEIALITVIITSEDTGVVAEMATNLRLIYMDVKVEYDVIIIIIIIIVIIIINVIVIVIFTLLSFCCSQKNSVQRWWNHSVPRSAQKCARTRELTSAATRNVRTRVKLATNWLAVKQKELVVLMVPSLDGPHTVNVSFWII